MINQDFKDNCSINPLIPHWSECAGQPFLQARALLSLHIQHSKLNLTSVRGTMYVISQIGVTVCSRGAPSSAEWQPEITEVGEAQKSTRPQCLLR